MITRHFLTLPASETNPARRVHYRRCGTGPVLVMVHQSPRSSLEYERLMQEWAPHFTCIVPDTPGFGHSDALPGEPDINDYADALDQFLAALGVTRCAAYGFHSGGIILITALKRRSERFSCLAVGGYAVWTQAEMDLFGKSYLPPFVPSAYGEHLIWVWNRLLEQSWYFPWFDARDEARLPGANADFAKLDPAVMDLLDAGKAYRAGYRAVLNAPRDIPPTDSVTPPVLITAFHGDPLQEHIDRLGPMPAGWAARKVDTQAEHEAQSLAFLQTHVSDPCPPLAQDDDHGFVVVNEGLVHWHGQRGAKRMVLHQPGAELVKPGANEVAIDVPGHGLSDAAADIGATIEAARVALGASEIVWPALPPGDPALLYPDLSPDRFGSYLTRAWSVARAQAIFAPWYLADKDHTVPIDPAALDPEAIALRTRALLRARAEAPRYHAFLNDKSGKILS